MPDGTSSTDTSNPTAPIPPDTTPTEPTEPSEGETLTVTQAEIDRIVQGRVARESQRYADYDAMKSKLAAIEDRDKTELERANDAREKAIADAAKANRELLILRAASKHGVPAEYVDLIDGDDEAAIEDKATRIAALAKANAPADGEPIPKGYRLADPGQTESDPLTDGDAVKEAFARQLFKLPAQ